MQRKTVPAVVLAALLLTACGSAPSRPAVTDPAPETQTSTDTPADTGEESTAAGTGDTSVDTGIDPNAVDALGVSTQITLSWAVEPTIEADNIDVLRMERGNGNDYDFNAIWMHRDDGLCVIEQNGLYGLIDYEGNIVVPVEYTDIRLGYDARYAMTKDGTNYDTLNADGSITPLGESVYVDVLGTAPNREVYWVPSLDALYLNGGADSALEMEYTTNVPCSARVVNELDEYDCPVSFRGVTLTNGQRPVYQDTFGQAGAYSSGLIPMKQADFWGYQDGEGNLKIAYLQESNWDYANRDLSEENALAYAASYGTVVVTHNGKDGLYDSNGVCLINYGTYEDLRPVHGDKLWARQDGKWGVLQLDHALSTSQTGYAAQGMGVTVMPDSYESRMVVADADSGLVLRAGPGTDYDKLGTLPSGTVMQVQGTSATVDGWLYVDQGGWVSAEYVVDFAL